MFLGLEERFAYGITAMGEKINIGIMQIRCGPNKDLNLKKAVDGLEGLKGQVDIAVLPEYLMGHQNGSATVELVEKLAEPLDSPYVNTLRNKAQELGISILFTMHLKQNGYFNSAIFVDEKGEIRGVYNKTHLFDAFGFNESRTFKRGEEIVVIDWKKYKMGLAICFDIRFPELFRIMRFLGSHIILVPSAFLAGPHKVDQWIALIRARAHENNLFVVAVNQPSPYFIGKSMVVSPFGNEIVSLKEDEEIRIAEIDISEVFEAREKVPTHRLTRFDMYNKYRPYMQP